MLTDRPREDIVIMMLLVLRGELEHCNLNYFADRLTDVTALITDGIEANRLEQIKVDAECLLIQAASE